MLPLLPLLILAHGAYPLAYQLQETPGHPQQLVAGTTFGLLLSDDDGQRWRWVCEEAVGYGTNLNPTWWVSSTGTLRGASFKGLFSSTDKGCTWSSAPEFADLPDGGQGTGVADLYGDATALFAVTGKYGVTNKVWRSTDEGGTWAELAVKSDSEFYTTVRTAPSRPQRVYVAAWWFKPSPTEALYVSDNGGDTFERIDVSAKLPQVGVGLDGGRGLARGSFYVYAVDPREPDILYAGLQQDDDPRHSFVLRSGDRGQSWAVVLDLADQLNGVVLAPNPMNLWAATSGNLYFSNDVGDAYSRFVPPTRQTCVSRFDSRLYMCGWFEVDGFAVARMSLPGAALEPVLTWPRVVDVQQCGATSKITTLCKGFFPALQATFPVTSDGGLGGGSGAGGGAGGAGGSGGGADPSPGCRCSLGGAELSLTLWLVVGRLAKAHALRRRRVHR
ncbi:MAG: hypothetical protein IPJ65_08105 [Archangiaceae bacterium]|nr:hypothetical protein [Archangiaceae bacterium]